MSDEKRSEDDAKDEVLDNPNPPQTAEQAIEDSRKARTAPDDEDEDEEDEDAVDSADPAAIARRVAALGDEDESDRLAREEERKLAERRAANRKPGKKKKAGLEVAASKKLSKIGTRAEPKRTVAVASDADPLIEKTAKLGDWAKANQKTVQVVGGLLAAALFGIAGYMYWDHSRETKASVALSEAIETQGARVGEAPKGEDVDDDDKSFKTHEERREAALKSYREVEQKFAGTGAAILARLAEGSLLLDKRDADGAVAAFEEVKSSALGAADKEVKGRALEGLGFAYELKAVLAPGDAAKFQDQALASYRELESALDVRGFKELAMYHQARVLENKGEKDKAKELLLSLKTRIEKPEETTTNIPGGPAFPYLREVAMDRLRAIDPSAAPKIQGMPGGGAQVLPPELRKMIEQQQKKQQQQQGGGSHDGHGH